MEERLELEDACGVASTAEDLGGEVRTEGEEMGTDGRGGGDTEGAEMLEGGEEAVLAQEVVVVARIGEGGREHGGRGDAGDLGGEESAARGTPGRRKEADGTFGTDDAVGKEGGKGPGGEVPGQTTLPGCEARRSGRLRAQPRVEGRRGERHGGAGGTEDAGTRSTTTQTAQHALDPYGKGSARKGEGGDGMRRMEGRVVQQDLREERRRRRAAGTTQHDQQVDEAARSGEALKQSRACAALRAQYAQAGLQQLSSSRSQARSEASTAGGGGGAAEVVARPVAAEDAAHGDAGTRRSRHAMRMRRRSVSPREGTEKRSVNVKKKKKA